jgi:hypothetical protein
LTLAFEVSDRFRAAAAEWGDQRLMDETEAIESKAEQALLEIEHLVSGDTDVEFDVDGRTVRHHPSDELRSFLEAQAAETDLDAERLLKLHVDLFARVFLNDDSGQPAQR